MKDQECKEKNKWKEWISKETRDLIIRRREAMYVEDECLARELKKIIRKLLREDKRKWEDELTKKGLGETEQWQGLRYIGQTYKPKRYARRDRNGRLVNMDMRAEATKEYLEKDQWGKKEEPPSTGPPGRGGTASTITTSNRSSTNRTNKEGQDSENTSETLEKQQKNKKGESSINQAQEAATPPMRQKDSHKDNNNRELLKEAKIKGELAKKAIEVMEKDKEKYKDVIWNAKPPTTAEI